MHKEPEKKWIAISWLKTSISWVGHFHCVTNGSAEENWSALLTIHISTLGSDPLVRTLYEFDEHKEDLNLGVKPMSRSLWKYRRQINVEHLANSFQQEALSAGVNQNKVLGAFLKQVKNLFS